MADTKIQGKFYPLQNSEWVKCCKNLTKSQISVLYYLRSLDPYSNGIKVKVSKIAEELEISKKAVYAAITVLEENKYICLEETEYSIKVSSGGCLCDSSFAVTYVLPPGDNIHPVVTAVTTGLQDSPGGDNIHPVVTAVTTGLQVEPERLVEQGFQNSKINKTYLDFIRSLSEGERENFLDFGLKKAAQLPKEPELPLKWIKANFEELKELWLKEQEHSNCARANSTSSTSSTKVQNFDLWESSSHQGQYHTLMSLGLAKFCENRISKSWYEWAKAKYPEKFIDIPL